MLPEISAQPTNTLAFNQSEAVKTYYYTHSNNYTAVVLLYTLTFIYYIGEIYHY